MTGAMARKEDGTPLFTMLPGAVGSSHALDAAAREGLPEDVIARAKQLIPELGCASAADGECELDDDELNETAEGQLRRQTELLISALQARMADTDAAASAAESRLEAAEAARAEAKEAATRAVGALSKAETFLAERTRYLDTLVARLRKEKKGGLELIGETLKALRLAEVDASQSRERALADLGLQPVKLGMRLRTGEYLSFLVEKEGEPLTTVDAVVMDDASESEPSVKVSVGGMPPSYVPRGELATWYSTGGGADDFGDMDMWGYGAGASGAARY